MMALSYKRIALIIVPVIILVVGYYFFFYYGAAKHHQKLIPVDAQIALNERLQSVVDLTRKKNKLVGLSVSVSLPEGQSTLNYTSGVINLQSDNLIKPETPFQVGSITKTFIATLTLILDAKEALSIDNTIGDWIKIYPKWSKVTIKQLLNHTSGLYQLDKTEHFWDEVVKNPFTLWDLKALADLAYQHPLNFIPGTGYNYSNTDYIVLGMIIEKATGLSIQQNLALYLTGDSLNLRYTEYYPQGFSANIMQTIAHGYNNEGTFPPNTDVTEMTSGNFGPAGGLVSTPGDLVRFIRLLFSGQILPKDQMDKMLSLVSEEDGAPLNPNEVIKLTKISKGKHISIGTGLGLGLLYFDNGGYQWMHAGGRLGYEAMFAYSPCNNIIVTLAYNTRPEAEFTYFDILEKIYNVLNDSAFVVDQSQAYASHGRTAEFCDTPPLVIAHKK